MDPISIAFGLAQFAPSIIKWITGDDKSAKVAEKVIDVARVVTGKQDAAQAVEAIRLDPAIQLQFQQHIIDLDADLERAYLADIQDARKRDTEFLKAGKRNTRADIIAALALIGVLALTVAIWRDPSINEYAKGTFTLVLGRLLGYVDQVFAFEFGTTRGSKSKDETINQLIKG
jgi:hypothetical protein